MVSLAPDREARGTIGSPRPTRQAGWSFEWTAFPMTDAETRVLARTAAVLLVVSAARYGWELRRGPPALPEVRDDLPELLAESRRLEEENARRALPLGPGERIDPNRASETELDRLPGVGPATARAIVDARERGAAFAGPDDLLGVRGIGPATLERMRPHLAPGVPTTRRLLASGGSSPSPVPGDRTALVDLNRATAAELERLPGVGPALAGRILEARRTRGRFKAAEELLEVRGIGPATLERLRPLVTTHSP